MTVRALSHRSCIGLATIGPVTMQCGLGWCGLKLRKREGDGATPVGRWRVTRVWYRPDRVHGFYCDGLLRGAKVLRPDDGWCDAVGDRNYNRHVRHPYPASAEALWRNDHLYDVIVVLEHNQRPRVQGGGSAIFMHLGREVAGGQLAPTAGCVSLRRRDLAQVLGMMRPGSAVHILG